MIRWMIAALFLFQAGTASAHGMRTAFLEIVEREPGIAAVTFKRPLADDDVRPIFPDGCVITSNGGGSNYFSTMMIDCPRPLRGARFGVEGLGPILSEAILRFDLSDGATFSHLLLK